MQSLFLYIFLFFSYFWRPFFAGNSSCYQWPPNQPPLFSLAKLLQPLFQLLPLPRFTSINLITKLFAHSRKCFAAYRTQFSIKCSFKTLTFKMMGLQKAWSIPHSGQYYTNAGKLEFKRTIFTVRLKDILILPTHI